jgi:hypothetical protein
VIQAVNSEVLRQSATLNGGLTPGARPQIAFPFFGSAANRHMSPRSWAGHDGSDEQMFGAKQQIPPAEQSD